jgi:hypothetical protein
MASLSERLEAAAMIIAGSEAIKDRLHRAWSLHLADLHSRDFPRDLRDDFIAIQDALSRERALAGDSVLKASLRKLSAGEAARFATTIVRAYGQVAMLKSAQEQLLPRAVASASIPQVARLLSNIAR